MGESEEGEEDEDDEELRGYCAEILGKKNVRPNMNKRSLKLTERNPEFADDEDATVIGQEMSFPVETFDLEDDEVESTLNKFNVAMKEEYEVLMTYSFDADEGEEVEEDEESEEGEEKETAEGEKSEGEDKETAEGEEVEKTETEAAEKETEGTKKRLRGLAAKQSSTETSKTSETSKTEGSETKTSETEGEKKSAGKKFNMKDASGKKMKRRMRKVTMRYMIAMRGSTSADKVNKRMAKAESLATKGSDARSKMSKKMRELFVQSKKASKKSDSTSAADKTVTEKKTTTTVAPASASGNAARKLQVQDDTFNANMMNVTRPARMTVDQADAQIAALNLMAMSQSSNAADYNSMLNTNYNSETQSTTQTNSNTDSSTSSNTDSASKTTSSDSAPS